MTNDAEAQEIQGTVVSSGRFPEPADQAEVRTPEDQEKAEEEERPDSAQPGYSRVAADRGEDAEVVGPDAVIIDQADETPDDDEDDEAPADETPDEDEDEDDKALSDDTDETPAYAETNDAPADEGAADDETPAAVAGFARTPVASPASAAADAVPEADVIGEAARPGVPGDAEVPTMGGLAGDPAQLHEQWSAIQSSFVDDPRASVAAAAELVTEAIEALMAAVQERERGLRGEWERGGADTEDLRNTLRGYRGLLDQLAGL
jgi:hypothetical protein